VFLDHGHHIYDWVADKELVDPSMLGQCRLAYAHFHNRHYEPARRAASQKLRNRIPDFSRETLESYRGVGFHLTSILLTGEREYYSRFFHIHAVDISREFDRLGVTVPFSEPPHWATGGSG
jgi:hypothetical protein